LTKHCIFLHAEERQTFLTRNLSTSAANTLITELPRNSKATTQCESQMFSRLIYACAQPG